MIQIKEKKDCCGCNACGDACAQNAITFKTDNEGFWYPEVDVQKCNDCGLCNRICPMLNLEKAKSYGQRSPRVYGGYHKNIAIRFDSTSGGAFSALANTMYKQGGYVSGAVFNDDWTVSNFISNDKKDLSRLRSSKYVESYAEGLYKEIRKLLLAGEKVLACGSPCQMAGLRTFLGKDYENLVIVDFLCRATNSPKAYRKYLDYLEDIYGGKITYIKAKNKDHGWRSLARKVVFDNGKTYYGEGHEDHYRRGYHGNYFERPSCYDCKFKGIPRIADITLADFWGIENIDSSIDGNLGTSMILVNTEKGQKFLDKCSAKMILKEYPMDVAFRGNHPAIYGDCKYPEDIDRDAMFRDMDVMRFDEVANKYFPQRNASISIKSQLKQIVKRLLFMAKCPTIACRNIIWHCRHKVDGDFWVYKYSAVDLRSNSKIKIEKGGKLIFGVKKNMKSKLETRLLIEPGGKLTIAGERTITYNSDIQVFKNAELSFGSGSCNSGLQIVCANKISIGSNTFIGRDVWIRDNNGGHHIIQTGYTNSAPVMIGDYVWIGSNVHIMKGVTIGNGAVIAANSVVTTNIPAHCLAAGNPAVVVSEDIKWVH